MPTSSKIDMADMRHKNVRLHPTTPAAASPLSVGKLIRSWYRGVEGNTRRKFSFNGMCSTTECDVMEEECFPSIYPKLHFRSSPAEAGKKSALRATKACLDPLRFKLRDLA